MNSSITLAARMTLDAQRWVQGIGLAQSKTRGFVSAVRREFAELKSLAGSTAGALASVGLGYSAGAAVVRSAQMDRELEQVRQVARATNTETAALREQVFALGKAYGVSTDEAMTGFRALVAGGLDWQQSMTGLKVMSEAVAVTKSSYTDLAGAMKAAAANFGVDQGNLAETTRLLNEMAAAADAGSAEVGNLASIFGALGTAPKDAGMSRQRTMAYIEALSGSVDIGNLGTRAKSMMMLFGNQSYMRDATKATGVPFYENGKRRDDIAILTDIRKVLEKQTTQQARDELLFKAFGKADQDMQLAVRFFTSTPGSIERLQNIDTRINSAGTRGLAERVPAAINNAVDQSARLKAALGEAADRFAQPINSAITRAAQYALNSKEKGGLALSGEQMFAIAAAAIGGGYVASRVGKGLASKLGGGVASLGTGLAVGNALEKAGAAAPVYVVGAAPGVFGGASPADVLGGATAAAGAGGARGTRTRTAMRTGGNILGALLGWELGTQVGDWARGVKEETQVGRLHQQSIGLGLRGAHAIFSKEVRDELRAEGKRFQQEQKEREALVRIQIDDRGARVTSVKTKNLHVQTGQIANRGRMMSAGMPAYLRPGAPQ